MGGRDGLKKIHGPGEPSGGATNLGPTRVSVRKQVGGKGTQRGARLVEMLSRC